MASLFKKLTTVFLAVTAALCLATGILFTVQKTPAFAEDEKQTVNLDDAKYFNLVDENKTFAGLSDAGKAYAGENNIIVKIPDGVTKIAEDTSTGTHIGILENYSSALVELVIPSSVVEIGNYAFYGSSNLATLDTSNATALKTIGEHSFDSGATGSAYSVSLKSITVPESVTAIGNNAFANRTGLTEINFYATNCADFSANAAENPFYKAGYSANVAVAVNIGSNSAQVLQIPANMFKNDSQRSNGIAVVNFVNANIAEGKFGVDAFNGCRQLTIVNFASSTFKEIGNGAFNGTAIETATIPSGVEKIGERAFQGNTTLKAVTFNEGLKTIGNSAFNGCTSLGNVTIPTSVNEIGNSAFQNCKAFTVITVPTGVKSLGENAFYGCSSAKTINYYAKNAEFADTTSPFANGANNVTLNIGNSSNVVNGLSSHLFRSTNVSTVILNNVKITSDAKVANNIFTSCTSLKTVKFENCQLTAIDYAAFYGCTSLTSIDLSDTGVSKISEQAFYGCTSLTDVKLPSTLTEIEGQAFENCSAIYKFTVPSNVTSIGDNAFTGCIRLIEVENQSGLDIKTKAENNNVAQTEHGGVSQYALNVYKTGDGNIQAPDANGYVFYDDGAKVYLITYVGDATRLTLPANYNGNAYEVYNRAFMNNAEITSVALASGSQISKIDSYAFLGCTTLTSVDLTGGPSTMGDYVFQNCTALSQVKLPANLTNISMYTFSGCASISAIKIPSNVGAIYPNAFENCTSLTEVTFAEDSKLSRIDGSAFAGCSRLSVIKIPEKVTAIQSSAFAGCTNLLTVYLPETLTNIGTAVFPASSGLTLIAPSKEAYDTYIEVSELRSYRNNLTYKIAINLVYDCIEHSETGEGHHTEYRLFFRNYNWVEQADGSWLPNGGLPVQHGYEQSVWYQENTYVNNVLNDDWLNRQLQIGVKEINIYAQSVETPTVTAKENLEYSSDKRPNWQDLVKEEIDTDYYSVEITGYQTYYNRENKAVPEKLEAGYYTVTITLAEGYGIWSTSCSITVCVEPVDREASIYLEWVQHPSGAQLGNYVGDDMVATTLYIYDEGGKEVPYLSKQVKDEEEVEPKRTVSVKASHVSYTGNYVTIVLSHDGQYFTASDYYTVVSSYTDNSERANGVYTATVTIAANNNYRFNNETIEERGLRVTNIAGTNRYTITKVWYIAVDKSNAPLLGNSEYRDQSWTYNKGNAPVAPSLVSGKEDELITFSLYRYPDTTRSSDVLSGIIVDNARYSRFGYYVNNSMPAGRYTLTINVEEYISDSGESMSGGTYEYELNVGYAFREGVGLSGTLQNNQSLTLAQTYAYDGKPYFGDVSSVTALDIDAASLHPTRTGFWAEPDNAYMYEGFGITYDIVRAQAASNGGFTYPASNGRYYTADEYKAMFAEDDRVVVPCDIGVYRVYYNVCAPSYSGLIPNVTNQSSRENYFFTIKVYGLVTRDNLPEISSVDYTGSSVTPYVNDRNGWFDVHYLDLSLRGSSSAAVGVVGEDKYVEAGTHNVALTIKSAYANVGLLVWDNDVNPLPNENKTVYYALASFRITPAENEAGTLYFTSWNWGKFDSTVNRPVWSTKYVGYGGFTFTLTSSTGKVYTYGDENNGFDKADAGTYTLRAYAEGNTVKNTQVTGYNWYECSSEITVAILPATISWDTAPYILSWKYGDYKTMFSVNEGVLNASYGNLKDLMNVYYCLEDDVTSTDTSKHYDSITSLVQNGEIPAGSYALVYVLDETTNYEKWVYPVYFSVLKADNYWDITPTVTGWYYGDANIDYSTYKPDYKPHVGDASSVKITYCMLDENLEEASGWKSTLAELGLDAKNNLPVGNYALKAEMAATGNYESMEFVMNFTVSRAQNSWVDIPGVVSWSEGRWKADKNAFTASDMYGSTVYISVVRLVNGEDGDVIIENQKIDEINVNTLKALSVGSYKLIAHVEKTYDHEGLDTAAYFAVLEDSVGLTGLIAASMVFAVIAIGLAVGSAVLLIRRNKKVEDEFRKLIKSELHRR